MSKYYSTQTIDTDLLTGIVPLKEIIPYLNFKGTPIPQELWKEILNFFLYSWSEYKGETVIRGYYCQKSGKWAIIVFPQTPSGMTIKEDEPDKETLEWVSDLESKGFYQIMSIHHHCSLGAFQSGVDERDELAFPGLHITVGNLDDEQLSIHSRVTFNGRQFKANLVEWVSYPDWFYEMPVKYQQDLSEPLLTDTVSLQVSDKAEGSPEQWRKQLKKVTRIFGHSSNIGYGSGIGNGYGYGMYGGIHDDADNDYFGEVNEILDNDEGTPIYDGTKPITQNQAEVIATEIYGILDSAAESYWEKEDTLVFWFHTFRARFLSEKLVDLITLKEWGLVVNKWYLYTAKLKDNLKDNLKGNLKGNLKSKMLLKDLLEVISNYIDQLPEKHSYRKNSATIILQHLWWLV